MNLARRYEVTVYRTVIAWAKSAWNHYKIRRCKITPRICSNRNSMIGGRKNWRPVRGCYTVLLSIVTGVCSRRWSAFKPLHHFGTW
jgi:hypothetical protein